MKRKRSQETVIKPHPSSPYASPISISISNSSEERRVLDQSKSLLESLMEHNFEKIKDEIVHTITSFPSAFVIKSLVCCIFDMVITVDNAYVLLARLSLVLFHALPPFLSDDSHVTTFKLLLLCKCRMSLQNSPPGFVEDSNCLRFIKTLRVLADAFKNGIVDETTRASAVQEDPARLGKEAQQDTLHLQGRRMKKAKLHQLETLQHDNEKLRFKADKLEGKYKVELRLRKQSESALDKKGKELEEMKQRLETCKTEQEKLNSQVRAWQDKLKSKHKMELVLRKSLDKEKQELEIVKGLLESSNKETDAMRQERDKALILVQELRRRQKEERQPLESFFCPITQEVMEDPHLTADGFTYEAEAIREWFSKGHDTSPMTNLKLPHLNLVPNRTLRSAIHDFL
ncbi:unnamed protein product [Microthlaspi erraticum]|uniref:RING-type E3 ubiquitin transferase n=1 Tax=Microthlaspi erraticum TaxID=1685480 RepID=A0A6D2IP56_9BRAS|nr:unnamed protein product [Microthlaspi erraticum]